MQTLNGNNYYLNLNNPFGSRIATIDKFIKLDYARSVNNIGALTAIIPIWFFPLVKEYSTLEVWRTAAPGTSFYLDLETIWIIVSYRVYLTEKGELLLEIKAVDTMALLFWRYVVYFAGSAQSSKTGLAGNVIKAVARENVSSAANDFTGTNTTRGLASSVFSVAADLGDGTTIALDFAWRNVLDVLQNMADMTTNAGFYLAFDVVANPFGILEFRTYANQRGSDHRLTSQNPVIIDPTAGNATQTSLDYSFENESNYIYCAGQGENALRNVKTAFDLTRINAGLFARREYFQDARQSALDTQIQNQANAMLRAGRGLTIFDNQIIQTGTNRLGIEYNYGDIIPAQFQGRSGDFRLDKINVTVENSKETILTRLQSVV